MNALLYFAPLFVRQHRRLLVTLILSLLTLASGIALFSISGWFLTAAALTTAGAAFNLFAPSAGVRGLSFVRILSRYGEKLTGHDATLRVLSDIRRWLFGKLFPIVPLGRQRKRADLVSGLTADVEALDTAFLVALGPISTAALAGLAMSIGLAIFSSAAALAYAGSFFAAAVAVPVTLTVMSRRAGKQANEASAVLRQAVLDGLDCHQDLVLFGQTCRATQAASAAGRRFAHARRRLGLYGALASAAVQMAAGTALVGALLACLPLLEAGHMDGPMLVGLVLAVVASFEASAVLVRSTTRLASAAVAAERLRDLAQSPASVPEASDPVPLSPGGAIRFDAVTFGYDPMRPVLKDVSFTIDTGTVAAIVGPSGAGKSSLAMLLLRLCDPQGGSVQVNNIDVRAVRTAELHRQVALMTQDAPIFLDTVRENLRIGAPAADDSALWGALKAVQLDGLVASMPQGLDSYLGEAGLSLSAGQARRLCLARTLLSGAAIIILDEPTSGLDHETEAAFLADLTGLAKGRTVVVITHASLPPSGFHTILSLTAGKLIPLRRPSLTAGNRP